MSTTKNKFPKSFAVKICRWKSREISVKITLYLRRNFNLFYQSKKFKLFLLVFCIFAFDENNFVKAQEVEIKIKILPEAKVRIEGKFLDSKNVKLTNQISFLNDYADTSALGNRIENFEAFDADGAKIEVKKLPAGEYRTDKIAAGFAYNVKIAAPENPLWKAHISWLEENQGLLMLNDLLPEWTGKTSGKIILETPNDWNIATREKKLQDKIYAVENIEKAIFLIGKNWREKTARIEKTNLNLIVSGEWQFTDDEILEMATSILSEYQKLFGEIPTIQSQIFIFPISGSENSRRWRAETRGQTVTIISGSVASKREALQRLHEQLRHEIFHFWIPNAVNLTGNYDWFYEGFTVYEALKIGVWLNQIRFEDYLNTLGQAFDFSKNQEVSLVEMSNKRWTGTNNSVYAKGMIVAFLCDLAMLNQSKGKHSVAGIFQKLYRKYHVSNSETDANSAVLEILNSYPELPPLIKKYITGNEKVVLSEDLKAFGIENSFDGMTTRMQISTQLNGRQKDLLDKLGYNRWRKLLK